MRPARPWPSASSAAALFLLGCIRSTRAPKVRPGARNDSGQGRNIVELVVGLVTYAIIWTVVIFGSEYVNKNIQ